MQEALGVDVPILRGVSDNELGRAFILDVLENAETLEPWRFCGGNPAQIQQDEVEVIVCQRRETLDAAPLRQVVSVAIEEVRIGKRLVVDDEDVSPLADLAERELGVLASSQDGSRYTRTFLRPGGRCGLELRVIGSFAAH